MQKEALYRLLKLAKMSVYRDDGQWLTVSCPISYKTHTDGDDANPSCGISYDTDKPSIVNCFACGSRPLSSVLFILYSDGKISNEVFSFFLENEILKDEPYKVLEVKDIFDITISKNKPIPGVIFDRLLPANRVLSAQRFFKRRRINSNYLNGLFFWDGSIVFPLKDAEGNVYRLHCRNMHSKAKKRFFYLEPSDFGLTGEWSKKGLWYGLDSIDASKPIILVEGEFDRLRLMSLGYFNVLASCGPLGKEHMIYLKELCPTCLYLGFDSDKRGRQYSNKIISYFKNYTPLYYLDWSIAGIKDAGDIKNQQQLEKIFKKVKFIS